jgi:hypothetical protein
MSSADSEIQRDELDALTSILDETAFEINEKSTTTETTNGTLVIEVTLSDEFYIEYHSSMNKSIFLPFFLYLYSLDQRRRVEYLPPIFLRFNLPTDYPSISPPSFQLECIWMIDKQVNTHVIRNYERHSCLLCVNKCDHRFDSILVRNII